MKEYENVSTEVDPQEGELYFKETEETAANFLLIESSRQ